MRTDQQIAAEADLAQAKSFAAQFRADREDLARQLARHVRALTEATNSSAASTARRNIRNVESELRQIDRVLEGLESRFLGQI